MVSTLCIVSPLKISSALISKRKRKPGIIRHLTELKEIESYFLHSFTKISLLASFGILIQLFFRSNWRTNGNLKSLFGYPLMF